VSGVVGLASLIPGPIRQSLTGLITGQKGNGLKVTAHGLMHASVVKNVLHMARQEMELIKELDDDFYATHVEKFIMYYSRNDQWAPLDHYEFMTEKFPNGKWEGRLAGTHIL
jgi:predicted alpha/beta hydrolase family esterase